MGRMSIRKYSKLSLYMRFSKPLLSKPYKSATKGKETREQNYWNKFSSVWLICLASSDNVFRLLFSEQHPRNRVWNASHLSALAGLACASSFTFGPMHRIPSYCHLSFGACVHAGQKIRHSRAGLICIDRYTEADARKRHVSQLFRIVFMPWCNQETMTNATLL